MISRSGLQVKAALSSDARMFERTAPEYQKGRKGAIIGNLNAAFGSDTNRRIALSWLFRGVATERFHSDSLTRGEWYVLDRWIGSWHDDSGWKVKPEFVSEAINVVRASLREYASIRFGVSQDSLVANGATLPGLKVISEQEATD